MPQSVLGVIVIVNGHADSERASAHYHLCSPPADRVVPGTRSPVFVNRWFLCHQLSQVEKETTILTGVNNGMLEFTVLAYIATVYLFPFHNVRDSRR